MLRDIFPKILSVSINSQYLDFIYSINLNCYFVFSSTQGGYLNSLPLLTIFIFIPRHTLVSGYYVIPFGVCPSVRPSVRPCSPFPIDNLSIYSRNFFKFCIHIVIGDEWYGIVNGQNASIFNGVTALFRIGKMVSGLLFLYCS